MSKIRILFPLLVVGPLAALMFMEPSGDFPRQAAFTSGQFFVFVALYTVSIFVLNVLKLMKMYKILTHSQEMVRLVSLYIADYTWIVYEYSQRVTFCIGKFPVVNVLFCITMILTIYWMACVVREKL